MSYSPNNSDIYIAAFTGMLTAIGAREPNGDISYQEFSADSALAFAQEVDTLWGSGSYTNLDVACIRKASETLWAARSPLPLPDTKTPGAYLRSAAQIVSLSQIGSQRVASEGIDPGTSHPATTTQVHFVINVKDPKYGAVGDGVANDTAAFVSAISDATVTSPTVIGRPIMLFVPVGVYNIDTRLVIDQGGPGDGGTNYIIMQGESGGHGAFLATTIRWVGVPGEVMLEVSNLQSAQFSNMNWDANNLAYIPIWMRAFSSGVRWDNIGYLNTVAIPPSQPGAPYSLGAKVVSPFVPHASMVDNGHLYVCIAAGTTGASPPVFPVTSGAMVVDGTVTWQESGFSPTCAAVGDLTGPFVGSQVDGATWRGCTFQGRGVELHASGTSPPAASLNATTPSQVIPAHVIAIVIKTTGGVGVGTFQWILNGVPKTTQTITSSFVMPSTGYTVEFPAGLYHNDTLYVWCQTMAAGWRALSGANVKQFGFEDCHWTTCGVGLDGHYGSGSYTLNNCVMSDNFCDLQAAGVNMVLNGFESEGSGYMLYGNIATSAPASCSFQNCSWSGNTPLIGAFTNYGSGDAFIAFGGSLSFEGGEWDDGSNSFPLIISAGSNLGSPVEAGSLRSKGTAFVVKQTYIDAGGELFYPVFDSNTNAIMPGSRQFYPGYLGGGLQVRFSTQDDYFTPDSGGLNIPIPRFDGTDLRLGRQMLASAPGELSPGVKVDTYGSPADGWYRCTVSAAAVAALGVSNTGTLTVAKGWGKTSIEKVYADISAFSGGSIATLTAEVGKTVPALSGVTTSNAYLVASNAMVTQKYGTASGDLGAALTNPVQGGDMIWGVTDGAPNDNKRWLLQVTFRSTGDTLNRVTAGSLVLYVKFDVLPGFNP